MAFGVSLLVIVLPASIPVGGATPMSDGAIEASCRHYFKHAVCSEALGRWLARMVVDPGRSSPRTPTHVFDGFRRTAGTMIEPFFAYAPVGTAFVHGNSGPPRGSAVYDRRHAVAFYGEGCCSYFSVVLAARVAPPPVTVKDRNLTGVATDSGLRLGDSPASVIRVYGSAPLQPVPGLPDQQMLLYENATPPKPGPCAQQQTFGFTRGMLSFIGMYDGC
jgi:hypothetical protein